MLFRSADAAPGCAPVPRLGRAGAAPGCAPEPCLGADRRREERRKGRKGRMKRKRGENRDPGERKEREEKENFECARVFRRSKPDYIAFGFFVKHEKLPI